MDYGIKVSEEGFDVFTAEDKNLSLKSGMTLLKVYDEGIVDLSGGAETIPHALGYEPQYLAWIGDGSDYYLLSGMNEIGYSYVSNTELFLDPGNGGIFAGTEAKYYLFYEQLDTGTAPPIIPTNDYGMKVSKDGVDVKTANILQQTFNSEKNSLKIALTGTDTQTVNTSYNFVIPHGLSVVPGFLVFFEVDNSGYWWSSYEQDTLSGKDVMVIPATNSSNLVVTADSNASCSVKIRYYIFADPAV